MEQYEPFVSLLVALAAGTLLGLEREQAAALNAKDEGGIGGIRTYPLFSLLGGVSSLLARQFGVWVLVASLFGVFGFLVAGYSHDIRRHHDRGLTSEGAFVLAWLLGAFALTDGVIEPASKKLIVVASVAVVATLFLSMKRPLHAFVGKVSQEDVYATLKFLIVAVVVLPLLPNATFGPLQILNPFQIGLMAVLIAAISFLGYVAVRALGPERGLAVTGFVGGLASSTAVTLTFSGRAKQSPELIRSCALAILLASTVMFLRILVVVAVVNRSLAVLLIPPIGAMLAAGVAFCFWLYLRAKKTTDAGKVEFHNPFELSSAIKFAALFAVVLLASKAAATYFGTGATYLAGALAGATDVDAISLSMAKLANGGMDPHIAARTIVIGAASNTVVKAGMATVIGGWALGRFVSLAFGCMLIVGAAVLLVQGV